MKQKDCLKLREDIIKSIEDVMPLSKKHSYIFVHSIDPNPETDSLFTWSSVQGDVGDLILALMDSMRKDYTVQVAVRKAAEGFDKFCLLSDGFIKEVEP